MMNSANKFLKIILFVLVFAIPLVFAFINEVVKLDDAYNLAIFFFEITCLPIIVFAFMHKVNKKLTFEVFLIPLFLCAILIISDLMLLDDKVPEAIAMIMVLNMLFIFFIYPVIWDYIKWDKEKENNGNSLCYLNDVLCYFSLFVPVYMIVAGRNRDMLFLLVESFIVCMVLAVKYPFKFQKKAYKCWLFLITSICALISAIIYFYLFKGGDIQITASSNILLNCTIGIIYLSMINKEIIWKSANERYNRLFRNITVYLLFINSIVLLFISLLRKEFELDSIMFNLFNIFFSYKILKIHLSYLLNKEDDINRMSIQFCKLIMLFVVIVSIIGVGYNTLYKLS